MGNFIRLQCHQVQRLAEDDFLSPLTIDERNDLVGPDVCQTSARCSDKGFLPMSLEAYFDLLNWLAQAEGSRRASYPESVSSTLQRLGIDGATFTELLRLREALLGRRLQ